MQVQQHRLVRAIMTAVCESAVCGEMIMMLLFYTLSIFLTYTFGYIYFCIAGSHLVCYVSVPSVHADNGNKGEGRIGKQYL